MDVGRYEGVAPSMSLKMTYVLQSSTLWQFATLLDPGKRTPPSPPKKSFFLSFPKETLTLGGVRFPGRTQVENWHCAGFPPFFSQHQAAFLGHRWRNSHSFATIRLGMPTLMAQLPHISRHPSTNLTRICHIDQSYPRTGGKTTRKDIRVIPRQEAKPPGKTSELSLFGTSMAQLPSFCQQRSRRFKTKF